MGVGGYRWQGRQASSDARTGNSHGTINLVTGSVDIGGSRTAVAMQAAEVLGLRAEDVSPTVVDTDTIGWTGVTGGSRQGDILANAPDARAGFFTVPKVVE